MKIEETVYMKMGVLGMPEEAMQSYTVVFDTEDEQAGLFKSQLNGIEAMTKLQVEFAQLFMTYLTQKLDGLPDSDFEPGD